MVPTGRLVLQATQDSPGLTANLDTVVSLESLVSLGTVALAELQATLVLTVL